MIATKNWQAYPHGKKLISPKTFQSVLLLIWLSLFARTVVWQFVTEETYTVLNTWKWKSKGKKKARQTRKFVVFFRSFFPVGVTCLYWSFDFDYVDNFFRVSAFYVEGQLVESQVTPLVHETYHSIHKRRPDTRRMPFASGGV